MAGTPVRVIALLKAEIPENISLNQFCKKTGINPNSVDKYLAGMTEPTQASLQKLADYFKTSIAYLRGEPWATRDGRFDQSLIEGTDESAVLRKEISDLISDLDAVALEKVRLLIIKFKKDKQDGGLVQTGL
jgi:transcriptional regulator with XRE-family HTH domain